MRGDCIVNKFVRLMGRDMIVVAPSGSGKSLIFTLQAIILAIEEEKTMPIVRGEGPFSLIIVPSVF